MRWRFWSRTRREQELSRELAAHVELESEELRESGLAAGEAQAAARRALGNVALVQESTREAWGWAAAARLQQDLRYAVRTLRQSPVFTTVAVLSLALGIGANTAIFTLLNAVVLRMLPVAEPEQLVQLTYTFPGTGPDNWNSYFGYPQLERFRDQARTVSGIFGGVSLGRVNVTRGGVAGLARCDAYTDNFFSVLGVMPQRGRLFGAGDDVPGASVAVLSDDYWRSRFDGDPAIVGQQITINQAPFTVIGIAQPDFAGIAVGSTRDIWVPLHVLDTFKPSPRRWVESFTSWLTIAGRLRPGVPLAQAQAELDVIYRRLSEEQLSASGRRTESLKKLVRESHLILRPAGTGVYSGLRQQYQLPLRLLMWIAGFVLLISCANVANLVMARAGHRRREIALRMALGSGRLRVVRQLLTESILLACAGGAAALAIAWWGGALLVRMITTGDLPLGIDVRPDWRVFGFTAAASLASGIVFGLAPAVRGTRVDPGAALKEAALTRGERSRAWDRVLVALQVTLSVVLVAGAGLFARSLGNLRSVDVGYQRDNILMFSIDTGLAGYPKERAGAVYRAVWDKMSRLPGVQSASVSIVRPVDDQYYLVDRVTEIDGRTLPERESIKIAWNAMGPGYFSTVGMRMVLGRDFEPGDVDGRKVVIVNESLARAMLPGQNPIGHRVADAEIVGVVKDVFYNGVRDKPRPVLYRMMLQRSPGTDPGGWSGPGGVSYELRATRTAGLLDEVRGAVASVDRNLQVFRVKTLRAQTEDSLLRERLLATISTYFGGLALLLACLGLYGLMAYAVARRTAEIGIRMALGAQRAQIAWLVFRETMWVVAAGVAAGIPLALWLARFAKSLLFDVTPADPWVLAAAVAALTAVAAGAGYLPARRAAGVDPMRALRWE